MGPLVRWTLLSCALLAAAAMIALLVFPLWKAKVDRDLDTAWRRTLGGPSFLERYPKSEDNETVREIEALGAAIGLDMAPGGAMGRRRPDPEAARRFADVKDAVKALLEPSTQSADGSFAAPPPAVAEYLELARPTLQRAVEVLLHDPAAAWQRDLEKGFDTRIPNLMGFLQLQRLLLLEARERIRNGRADDALPVLEASWRYNEALRSDSPLLIPRLLAVAVLKQQQPVLRSLPAFPPSSVRWRNRLDGAAGRSWILVGLQAEIFIVHRASTLERVTASDKNPQPFVQRLLLWDASRRFEGMLQDLVGSDPRTFDAESFTREQSNRLPWWQSMAIILQPNYWDAWGKAIRAELSADLTARVLEERERLASAGPPRTDRRPSRVPGLSWIYEATPEGTRIHLDGDLAYREPKPVPLRFLVRRPTRG